MASSSSALRVSAIDQMLSHADEAAGLLKSLAHSGRLRVMCRLIEGEASVSELQEVADLSMSALSQHLAVMREAGLVTTRRDAQMVLYSLVDGPALAVMQALHDSYCAKGKRRSGRR